jgi:hypothetical protein
VTASTPVSPLILAVSGSRSIAIQQPVWDLLDAEAAAAAIQGREFLLRVGDAHGVDMLALRWARDREVPRLIYFADRKSYAEWSRMHDHRGRPQIEDGFLAADWESEGPTLAGSKRNAAMLYGDPTATPPHPPCRRLLAIHDGVSPGTLNCIRQAELFHSGPHRLPIEIVYRIVLETGEILNPEE